MNEHTVGRPMEILLVEDGLTDARLAIEGLKKGGFRHRVTLVRDGAEALEFVGKQGRFARAPRPDIILLDLYLPKHNGMVVLSQLKNDCDLKSIPVVIMTSSDASEDRDGCELLQVDSFIKKPFGMQAFLQVVRELKRHLLSDVILPAMD